MKHKHRAYREEVEEGHTTYYCKCGATKVWGWGSIAPISRNTIKWTFRHDLTPQEVEDLLYALIISVNDAVKLGVEKSPLNKRMVKLHNELNVGDKNRVTLGLKGEQWCEHGRIVGTCSKCKT